MAGKSVNKVILIGKHWAQRSRSQVHHSGTPVAKLTLATNEAFQRQERRVAGSHRVAQRRALAASGGDRRRISEEGRQGLHRRRLQTRSWDDKTSGQKKYMTEVVANDPRPARRARRKQRR